MSADGSVSMWEFDDVSYESENIVSGYGKNVDIEDRNRTEEALRAREVSWRQIVDNIPGLVATTGAKGEVDFLNRQILEYFDKTDRQPSLSR